MKPIQMVDLGQQYLKLKNKINSGIQSVIDSTGFIKGKELSQFEIELGTYLDGAYIIGCGNGTDALQIALMALGLKPGDEVIVPSFTYVATAEVIALLNLVPVMVDVDPTLFTLDIDQLAKCISDKTRAIIPVHLYGQMAPMNEVIKFAKENNLFVIEDTAQAIGSSMIFNGETRKASTIGDIGCLSFFPSKNLGCYGDGGALVTTNKKLADKIRMVANHGQSKKYHHDVVGVNSRLDTIQAAVLRAKLPELPKYNDARNSVADFYDSAFSKISQVTIPQRALNSVHVFHQYTLVLNFGNRDKFVEFLKSRDIPSMVYYPVPIHRQKAYMELVKMPVELTQTDWLTDRVVSLPIHTEMDQEQLDYIIQTVQKYFD
jgi:dTDP-4-amino-4,6-dideoxygalactose transaminase